MSDGLPEFGDGTGGAAFEVGLELGEGHLDRVEIGAVGRQEAQLGPDPVNGLAHGGAAVGGEVVRTLIRIWVDKYEAGAFDEDAEAASTIQEYEARIAALERLVGRQALELEFLRGALKHGQRPRSAPMSVITGPKASPSPADAG